jgi:hypothetical protein
VSEICNEIEVRTPLGGALSVLLPPATGVAAGVAWLLVSCDERLLGLDVESDAGGSVALVQLSTATRALLLRWRDLLAPPGAFGLQVLGLCLADETLLKCGCELRKDALDLLRDSGGRLCLRGGRDVTPALRRPGAEGKRGLVFGLVDAFNARYGAAAAAPKDLAVTRSDWGAAQLSAAQVQYAALDAWMSYMLGYKAGLLRHRETRIVSVAASAELLDAAQRLHICTTLRGSSSTEAARALLAEHVAEQAAGGVAAASLRALVDPGSVRLHRLDRVWVTLAGIAARRPAVVVALGNVREEDGMRAIVLAHDALLREGYTLTAAAPDLDGAPEVLHIERLSGEEDGNVESVLERLNEDAGGAGTRAGRAAADARNCSRCAQPAHLMHSAACVSARTLFTRVQLVWFSSSLLAGPSIPSAHRSSGAAARPNKQVHSSGGVVTCRRSLPWALLAGPRLLPAVI